MKKSLVFIGVLFGLAPMAQAKTCVSWEYECVQQDDYGVCIKYRAVCVAWDDERKANPLLRDSAPELPPRLLENFILPRPELERNHLPHFPGQIP